MYLTVFITFVFIAFSQAENSTKCLDWQSYRQQALKASPLIEGAKHQVLAMRGEYQKQILPLQPRLNGEWEEKQEGGVGQHKIGIEFTIPSPYSYWTQRQSLRAQKQQAQSLLQLDSLETVSEAAKALTQFFAQKEILQAYQEYQILTQRAHRIAVSKVIEGMVPARDSLLTFAGKQQATLSLQVAQSDSIFYLKQFALLIGEEENNLFNPQICQLDADEHKNFTPQYSFDSSHPSLQSALALENQALWEKRNTSLFNMLPELTVELGYAGEAYLPKLFHSKSQTEALYAAVSFELPFWKLLSGEHSNLKHSGLARQAKAKNQLRESKRMLLQQEQEYQSSCQEFEFSHQSLEPLRGIAKANRMAWEEGKVSHREWIESEKEVLETQLRKNQSQQRCLWFSLVQQEQKIRKGNH